MDDVFISACISDYILQLAPSRSNEYKAIQDDHADEQ